MDSVDKTIDSLARRVGKLYHQLMIIYDIEYDHYVIEVIDNYGGVVTAGLGFTLEKAIEDVTKGLKSYE